MADANEINLLTETSMEKLKALAYDRLAALEQIQLQQVAPLQDELNAINGRIQQLIVQTEAAQAAPAVEHNGRVTTPLARKKPAKRTGAPAK